MQSPRHKIRRRALALLAAVPLVLGTASISAAQPEMPWMDASRAPEQRATLLIDAMTLEQKAQQLTGSGVPSPELLPECNGETSTGYGTFRNVTGIPELGIPSFRITNGPVGVGYGDCTPQEPATALPVALALAAGFDEDLA